MARWFPVALLLSLIAPTVKAESLRLSAALEWRPSPLRAGLGGMLLLEIPLGRMARPVRVSLAEPPPAENEPGLSPDSSRARAPAPAQAPQSHRISALPSFPNLRWARRLVMAALRAAGNLQAHTRLDSISTRTRASAVLPELTLRAARSTAETLRLSPSGVDSFDYTQTGGADLILEARATWKLDRLVFSDEELRVESLRAARDQVRMEIVALVLKHLFVWHRARARLSQSELDPEAELQFELNALEAEAALDVLTDGLFSATLAGRGRSMGAGP